MMMMNRQASYIVYGFFHTGGGPVRQHVRLGATRRGTARVYGKFQCESSDGGAVP